MLLRTGRREARAWTQCTARSHAAVARSLRRNCPGGADILDVIAKGFVSLCWCCLHAHTHIHRNTHTQAHTGTHTGTHRDYCHLFCTWFHYVCQAGRSLGTRFGNVVGQTVRQMRTGEAATGSSPMHLVLCRNACTCLSTHTHRHTHTHTHIHTHTDTQTNKHTHTHTHRHRHRHGHRHTDIDTDIEIDTDIDTD